MIRLRTTRGGVRDTYTSRKADGRLLGAEVPQEGDAANDDGVLRFPLATVASQTRRRDTLWLFLDASAGTSWLGATLAVFLDPATRALAMQSLDANPSEAERAERELATLAASFDILPVDNTATSSAPSRCRSTLWTPLIATIVVASILVGAGGGIALYRLSATQPKPGPSSVSLDAMSMKAIEDLSSRVNAPQVVSRLTDDEIARLASAVMSGLLGTEVVRARIETVVTKYRISTTDQDDASQSLINDVVAALRGM